ncbi:hypothetical protein HMPREF3037_02205 [Candidatus Stoquefichus sp. KLE1796]|nr:hypothetical protein HMPREF3037_02205 [Candidatus Stoquefichus sp. KLE1796]
MADTYLLHRVPFIYSPQDKICYDYILVWAKKGIFKNPLINFSFLK